MAKRERQALLDSVKTHVVIWEVACERAIFVLGQPVGVDMLLTLLTMSTKKFSPTTLSTYINHVWPRQ